MQSFRALSGTGTYDEILIEFSTTTYEFMAALALALQQLSPLRLSLQLSLQIPAFELSLPTQEPSFVVHCPFPCVDSALGPQNRTWPPAPSGRDVLSYERDKHSDAGSM